MTAMLLILTVCGAWSGDVCTAPATVSDRISRPLAACVIEATRWHRKFLADIADGHTTAVLLGDRAIDVYGAKCVPLSEIDCDCEVPSQ